MYIRDISFKSLLNEFVLYCSVDRHLEKHTLQQHLSHLNLINKFIEGEFEQVAIREFLYHSKNKDAGTIQGYIFTVRVFCDFLIFKGILGSNWGRDIPLPRRMRKLPHILSVEEIEALLTVPRKYHYEKHRIKWDVLFNLLAKTGCRIGEALSSKVYQFDLKKGEWRIEETKTKQQRLIPLSPDLIELLTKLVKNKSSDSFVFVSDKGIGTPLCQSAVREELRKRAIASGMTKRVTPHIFRHSFITELLRQDISILKVAMLCGHEKIGTTQEYAKLVTEDLRLAILRHPLIAKNRNPYEIMKHIMETIKKFRLDEDKRFFYELSEGNEGIRLNLFIR